MAKTKWSFLVVYFLFANISECDFVRPIDSRPKDEPTLYGLRVYNRDALVDYEPAGAVVVQPNVRIKVQAFGRLLKDVKSVMFTKSNNACEQPAAETVETEFSMDQEYTIVFHVTLPEDRTTYFVCLSFGDKARRAQLSFNMTSKMIRSLEYVHQGMVPFVTLKTRHHVKEYYMPLAVQIIIIVVLLILSGLFSGLNLGLMSLEKTELKILLKVGDPKERWCAQQIYPIRKSGNYLLCTLLLGNVFVNSSISILFDDLTTGYIALVAASLGIVIFGEIMPQAICTRYGLAVGAYTVLVTRFFMILTFPLSYPISKLLDKILGEEATRQVYNRERLLELIRMSKEQEGDLKNCQEVQIVTGALELSRKVVRDVMTNINDVYMLPSDAILDPKAVSEIVRSGYTRIPVFDPSTEQKNIVFILNVKDLALLDPEDKIPLMTICQFYQHPVRFVMEDSPLNVMLEEFKKGHYHLAIAQRIKCDGESDPVYEAVGLVTLEDIIEEIIQSEIRDEFDVIRDSRLKRMRRKETLAAMGGSQNAATTKDLAMFFHTDIDACDVSPQLSLATYQYLSTNLDAFKHNFINENVLLRLIRQNVIKAKPAEAYEPPKYLYQKGRETDQFFLILEGKCLISIGESNIIFEPGPFHYFGYEILAKISDNLPKQSSLFCSRQNSKTDHHAANNATAAATSSTPQLFDASGSLVSGNLGSYKFVPDFTLKITQKIIYFKVTAATYIKAYRATLIERGLAFGNDAYSNPRHKPSISDNKELKDGNEAGSSDQAMNGSPSDLGSSMPNINSSSAPMERASFEVGSSDNQSQASPNLLGGYSDKKPDRRSGDSSCFLTINRVNTAQSMDDQALEWTMSVHCSNGYGNNAKKPVVVESRSKRKLDAGNSTINCNNNNNNNEESENHSVNGANFIIAEPNKFRCNYLGDSSDKLSNGNLATFRCKNVLPDGIANNEPVDNTAVAVQNMV